MSGLGVLDASARGRLLLRGVDRVRFLQGMVTNEVAALAEGQSCRAALLNPKGHVLADLYVRAEAEAYLLSTDAVLREPLRQILDRHLIMDDATIEDISASTGEAGLLGPAARGLEAEARARGLRPLTTPLGLELVGEPEATRAYLDALVGAGRAVRLDDEAAEVLRIERGVSRWGAEITEAVLPLEAGLDEAISHTKGCYMGQEPVARLSARGHVNKKIVGLLCAALPKVGDRIGAESRPEAGLVTSAAQSPTLGRPIALGYLHRSLLAPGTRVTVGAAAQPAEVVELPFVKWA